MALKSIGILIALCATSTLTLAISQEVRFSPEPEFYHIESNNDKNSMGYGPYKPRFPNGFENSGGWAHHDDHKPYFPEPEEWEYQGFPKPYYPHSSYGIGDLTSLNKPNFPHIHGSGEGHQSGFSQSFPQSSQGSRHGQHTGLFQPNFSHSSHGSGQRHQSGFPHINYPHSSQGSGQAQHTGISQPNLPHNLHGLKDQHFGPTKPNFPHISDGSEQQRPGFSRSEFSQNAYGSEAGQHTGFAQPNFSQNFQGSVGQHASLAQQKLPHNFHGSAGQHASLSQLNSPHSYHESGAVPHTGFSESNHLHVSHGSQGQHYGSSQHNIPHNSHGHGHYSSFPLPLFPHNSHGPLSHPNLPHSFHVVEEMKYPGHPKPGNSNNSEELDDYHDLPKPHSPHVSHESGEVGLHTLPKPNSPDSTAASEEHHDIPTPTDMHSSKEAEEHHSLSKPRMSRSSEEQKKTDLYDYKSYRPDWYNPHFPQPPVQFIANFEEMERRRPLFYPIYPYHFYAPHVHPSANDEEFELIEALKGMNNHESRNSLDIDLADDSVSQVLEQQKYKDPYYHGPHNPHYPMNSENSENTAVFLFGTFYPGFPHHFKPSHKEPEHSEENIGFPPIVFEGPYINDDDFPTSDEAQPYELSSLAESNENFQGHFIVIGNDNHNLPSILLDILEHFHHGHGKPHHHGDHKPNEDENDNEIDVEGSGEEEIFPLFSEAKVPLMADDRD